MKPSSNSLILKHFISRPTTIHPLQIPNLRFLSPLYLLYPSAMNRRTRPTKPNPFHKFLKPGALARIRDSKITARRFNRLDSHCHLSLHPSPSLSNDAVQPHASDGFPCFVARIYAPRCPQRKKLMAVKSVFFVTASPTNSTTDSPDTVLVDSFSSDILVAN